MNGLRKFFSELSQDIRDEPLVRWKMFMFFYYFLLLPVGIGIVLGILVSAFLAAPLVVFVVVQSLAFVLFLIYLTVKVFFS